MTATLSPDLLAHVAAVRDGACDDNELLVLADGLHDAREYDREELIRVQVERERIESEAEPGFWAQGDEFRRESGVECGCHRCRLVRRERELLARNPAWLSAPCPECAFLKPGASLRQDCPVCDGTGDVLSPKGGGFLDLTTPTCRATITRGFLDVALPHTLCWRACEWCEGVGTERVADAAGDMDDATCRKCDGRVVEPHPVLRAILASPVGPWVRRVRVEGREPYKVSHPQPDGWEWVWDNQGDDNLAGMHLLPRSVVACLDGRAVGNGIVRFPTAEAATDALARAVVKFARGEG